MDRRDFLSSSTKMLAALPLLNLAPGLLPLASARESEKASKKISLSIITDNTRYALSQAQMLVQNHFSGLGTVQYTEYPVSGAQLCEIVLVSNGSLLNYKTLNTPLGRDIRNIAARIDVEKTVQNPVCLQFTIGQTDAKPKKVLIFRENKLIEQLPISKSNTNLEILGMKGSMRLNITGQKLRVVESSCQHKTCMHMGAIQNRGQSLACVPNQVSVLLT